MISLLLSLLSSPYSFEVKRGPSLEVVSSMRVNDQVDTTTYGATLRLSFISASEKDAFISPELSASFDWIPNHKNLQPKSRQIGDLGIFAYEIYNPWSFRVGVGSSLEHRADDWKPGLFARAGLGYYFTKRMSAWVDAGQRLLFRSKWSYPIDFGLGLQIVI